MRRIGIDYGDHSIGIAVSDELNITAQGLEVIRQNGNEEAVFERLEQLIEQYEVRECVVGLPKNMNGTIGSRGEICIAFADKLKQKLNVPVAMWDERLTTVSAERTLLQADVSRKKRKKVIDKMAAAFILQGYMDLNKKGYN